MSSTDCSLESTKQIGQGVVKHLEPKRIRFTTDFKPTRSSQDVRFSTRLQSMNVIAPSSRTISSISQTFESLRKDIATTNNSLQRKINSLKDREVVISNNVGAGPPPVGSTKTPQEEDLTSKVCSEVGCVTTFDDQRVVRQAPGGEESETLDRADKA